MFIAEREGFEPVEPVAQLGSLANYQSLHIRILYFFQHFKQPIVCANVCYKNIFGKCSSDKFLEKITFFSKNVIFCNFCARGKKENRSKFWNGFGGEDGIRTRDTITCMLV